MSNAGRKPVPTNVKAIRGTLRQDRVLSNEIQPRKLEAIPEPPSRLADIGKAKWWDIATEAKALGYLTVIALPQLERYCHFYEIYRDAWDKCHDENGNIESVIDKHGSQGQVTRVKNPYVQIMQDAARELSAIEVQWGWTPSSQTKVAKPDEAEDDDEFDL